MKLNWATIKMAECAILRVYVVLYKYQKKKTKFENY